MKKQIFFKWFFFLIFVCGELILTGVHTQELVFQQSRKKAGVQSLSFNSSYNEYMPFISPDGSFLLFQSDRPDGSLDSGDSDIWMSRRDTRFLDEIIFLPPENVGVPVNTLFLEGMSSVWFESKNQWYLYFTSILSKQRDNGIGETDIFYSFHKDGVFSRPLPVEAINTLFHDRMPYVALDGSMLFFTSNRPGGYGGEDIWISEYDKNKREWRKPYNAGDRINTKYDESSPAIHRNKVSLYFVSNRRGGYGGFDIYRSQKKELPQGSLWTKPRNLGNEYNSRYDEEGIGLSGAGEYIYFSSNRTQGKGLFDIYQHKLRFEFRSQLPVIFVGNVYIKGTKKGIEANIKISNQGLEHNLATNLPEGDFSVQLQSNDVYHIQVSAPGHKSQQYKLNLRDVIEHNKRRRKVFFLDRIEQSMVPKDSMIYKDKMMPGSQNNLREEVIKKPLELFYFPTNIITVEKIDKQIKKIYSIWKKDKTKQVVVEGHSGREGNSKKQKEISRKRSFFIRAELLKTGVPKEQLLHHWYGFARPVSFEVDSVSRAKNRRVEVYIY